MFVIVIVRQRCIDLSQCQLRMPPLQRGGLIAAGKMLLDQHPDFESRAGDVGSAIRTNIDVWIRNCAHASILPPAHGLHTTTSAIQSRSHASKSVPPPPAPQPLTPDPGRRTHDQLVARSASVDADLILQSAICNRPTVAP